MLFKSFWFIPYEKIKPEKLGLCVNWGENDFDVG